MKRRTRINYTPEQKAIIWDRYKQGDFLHDIARMFDKFHSSIMPTIHQTIIHCFTRTLPRSLALPRNVHRSPFCEVLVHARSRMIAYPGLAHRVTLDKLYL